MIIRKIQRDDNSIVEKIIKKSLEAYGLNIPGTAYFDESLKDLFAYYTERPQANYFVIETDDRVVGGAGYSMYDFEGQIAELEKLYIIPEYQGRGYSSRLFHYIEDQARKDNYKQLYIETTDRLDKANGIYIKWGFQQLTGPLRPGIHHAMNRFFIKEI